MSASSAQPPGWLVRASDWITLRRIRAHAILLAVCLWGICAVDFATGGPFDRAGNIKFQDFLPSYVAASLISQGRAVEIYDQKVGAEEMRAVLPELNRRESAVSLPYLYGPQVGLLFVPLANLSFPAAARVWVALGQLVYFGCVFAIWKLCPNLRAQTSTVVICAIAFPPLFHAFVRAQNSALVLLCFTAAYLALRAQREWLAGIALGFLIFKPQFLVALPLVLLLSFAWRPLCGLFLSAATQLAATNLYFGSNVMRAYIATLWHAPRWIAAAEPGLSTIQMHSLRSLWSLLLPWPHAAVTIYVISSVIVIAIAAFVWKSNSPWVLKFSALTLAAILVNPHLFVYDLLILAPAFLLLADWIANHPSSNSSLAFRPLLYAAFLLPLLGPTSYWTHLQLSVPAFVALLWTLYRHSRTPGHKLAPAESHVV